MGGGRVRSDRDHARCLDTACSRGRYRSWRGGARRRLRLRCHHRRSPSAASPGPVVGVDVSPDVLELARLRAAEAGAANLTFAPAGAQSHPFAPTSFGVVISRFGVMFFAGPAAAFANLARTTRPQG